MTENPSAPQASSPWERQPTETARQFGFFRVYRDLPVLRRSLAKVAEQLGCSQTYVQRLSSRNHWTERVGAFDAAQDRAEQKLREPQIREMRKRHAELAAAALERAREGLESLDPHSMRAADIARLLEVAGRLERVSRGVLDEPPEYQPTQVLRADTIRALLKGEGLL